MEPNRFYGRGARRKSAPIPNPIESLQSEEDSDSSTEFEIGSDLTDLETNSSEYDEHSPDENDGKSQVEHDGKVKMIWK